MAKWRTVHVNDLEWKWVRSKTRYMVVIRDPVSNALREVPFSDITEPAMHDEGYTYYPITPGNVKAYIEKHLV